MTCNKKAKQKKSERLKYIRRTQEGCLKVFKRASLSSPFSLLFRVHFSFAPTPGHEVPTQTFDNDNHVTIRRCLTTFFDNAYCFRSSLGLVSHYALPNLIFSFLSRRDEPFWLRFVPLCGPAGRRSRIRRTDCHRLPRQLASSSMRSADTVTCCRFAGRMEKRCYF